MFVITGGSSGIGAALAKSLASRQKKVLLIGRREALMQEIQKDFPAISYLVADLSLDSGQKKALEVLSELPCIEALIHNAGMIEPIAPLAEVKTEDWKKTLELNLNVALFLTQGLLKNLEGGRVLHIGSGAAYFPVAAWGAYCVSKAALAMLTQCWQLEQPKLSFAMVLPGIIDTPMQARIRESTKMQDEKQQFFTDLYKSQALISAETVACFLTWLLLDVEKEALCAQVWDIYDKTHHSFWLAPPYVVPPLDE